jgi:cytochrome bd-type quinol oxidase subunit 2
MVDTKVNSLPLPVGVDVYSYVRRNRKQAMQIVASALAIMFALALLGFRQVRVDLHEPGTGVVWTLVHPVHICIIVGAATLALAKAAEKTYRFAMAVTLTILAGIAATTATLTYSYVVLSRLYEYESPE